ncbi:cation:proton antiporter [Leucobacter chironomi]|uniref:cation:proton antiporter domain-containing protein n=1 Tax=Leucobacter chironomi TaxID=491918 RepID=UPI0003FDC784|nr:cation:proton antiporter [Leucobacter chironomi]
MTGLIIAAMLAILVWSLLSDRLRRWQISGPVSMVALGLVAGFAVSGELVAGLNTDLAERSVELILAVILFVDATEVRGGFLAGERGIVARLLGIALPLSLVLAVLCGIPLLGGSSLQVVLIVALVVMPVDFAPAGELLRDSRVPRRLRHSLTVESGYADAIRSPLFAVALIAASAPTQQQSLLDVVEHAIPEIGFAVLVGAGTGLLAGVLARASVARGWASTHGVRLGTALLPIIVYGGATALHGNGFLAAFLAGIAYKSARVGRAPSGDEVMREEVSLLDEIGVLSSLVMWFVFGAAAVLVFLAPLDWAALLYGLLALTLLRVVPVLLALLGSRSTGRDRVTLGVLGPRGTSTIMFGLLAFNALDDDSASTVLYVMVVTVLGSVLLHGVLGSRLVPALGWRSAPPRARPATVGEEPA